MCPTLCVPDAQLHCRYEKECQALQKDSKGYLDAMRGVSWLELSRDTVLTQLVAMTSTQARLADTFDVFYGAADKSSEGAMAAHAYKRAVEDLDTGVGRELVRVLLHCSGRRTHDRAVLRTRRIGRPLWSLLAR